MYFLPVKTYFDNKSLETIKNTDFKIGISFWHETWDSLDVENWKSFKLIENSDSIKQINLTPAVLTYYWIKKEPITGKRFYKEYRIICGTKEKVIRFRIDLRRTNVITARTLL